MMVCITVLVTFQGHFGSQLVSQATAFAKGVACKTSTKPDEHDEEIQSALNCIVIIHHHAMPKPLQIFLLT